MSPDFDLLLTMHSLKISLLYNLTAVTHIICACGTLKLYNSHLSFAQMSVNT